MSQSEVSPASQTGRSAEPADRLPAAGGAVASGGADLDTHQAHLFHLGDAAPSRYDGGVLQEANEETFPILLGQDASAVLATLEPGGIREPHWHPSAWELNFVISGRLRFTALETLGYAETFEAGADDLVFLPQGGVHYFENVGDDVARSLIVFNTSATEPRDDIGVTATISAFPSSVLGALFGVDPAVFDQLPRRMERLGVVRRPR